MWGPLVKGGKGREGMRGGGGEGREREGEVFRC